MQDEDKYQDLSQQKDPAQRKAYVTIAIFLLSLLGIVFILSKYLDLNILSKNKSQTGDYASSQDTFGGDLVDIESYADLSNSNGDDNNNGVENWREVVSGNDPQAVSVYDANFLKNNQTGVEKDQDVKVDMSSNFTDLVARDLYVAGKYAEKNPNINKEAVAQTILENMTKLFNPEKVILKTLVQNPNKKQVEEYGITMSYVLLAFKGNELEELKETKTDTSFTKTKEFYKKLVPVCAGLKTLSGIPESFASLHIDAVYNCDQYLNILLGITQKSTDSVKYNIALKLHQENFSNKLNNEKAFKDKLILDNKINFDIKANPTTKIYYVE